MEHEKNVDTSETWGTRVSPPPNDAQRERFGYQPLDYQTTFYEANLGRHAPINNQTTIGIPGTVPLPFSYLMRARYSEFDLRFGLLSDDGTEVLPYVLDNFKQESPGGWMPGCINQWDHQGVHYSVSVIVVPNDPQPFDLYAISIKNTASEPEKGKLIVTLDGAPPLKAEDCLFSDRGKPMVIMDPVVPTERIARPIGCVDPRTTPAAPWEHDAPRTTIWLRHRNGWYGTPIEYVMKVDEGEQLQVFLGYSGVPNITTPNWDEPYDKMEPDIRDLHTPLPREIIASVEGDPNPQKLKLERLKHVVQRFVGEDTDGDGYIKISVRATPESRQPAMLSWIRAYKTDVELTPDVIEADVDGTIGEYIIDSEHHAGGPGAFLRELKSEAEAQEMIGALLSYEMDVGRDFNDGISGLRDSFGVDLTAFSQRLHYAPTLQPGEERQYLLRVPAIDRPEPTPYGNPYHPYDTGESWRVHLEPRFPNNPADYGEDVPPDRNPGEYAIYGPKPRTLWLEQEKSARNIRWEEALDRVSSYWNGFIASSTRFITPEPVVEATYRHHLATLVLHQTYLGAKDLPLMMCGPFYYWDHTIRDCAYQNIAMGYAGFLDEHRALVQTVLTPREELPRTRWTLGQWGTGDPSRDGIWVTRTRQFDAQGQTLWCALEYWLLSGDNEWLAQNYRSLTRGADWVIRMREAECQRLNQPERPEYGLLPPSSGEGGGGGHCFYVNAFAYLGLRLLTKAAGALNKAQDASYYAEQAENLKRALHRSIEMSFVRFNDFSGTIPTNVAIGEAQKEGTFETAFGGILVHPSRVMGPHDPLMDAFFRFREYLGNTTGGLMVWPYIFVDLALGYIHRGEPDRAANLFYAFLANGSTTHDWSEVQSLNVKYTEFTPPKRGIKGGGDSPHSEACSNYIHFLRNLMLLEDEEEILHIAPATPRKWLAQPEPIGVENAPSHFGRVTYHFSADPNQTTIRGDVQLCPQRKPRRLLIHVRGPSGKGLRSVKLNGQTWDAFLKDTIIVDNPTNNIKLETEYIPK